MTSSINNTKWHDADQLDGLDILDKSHLVDEPFRIFSVRFIENKDGIRRVEIDAEKLSGETFTFQDSSTGVKTQIEQYLASKGLDAAIDSGEPVDISLVAPNGLRVSEYEVPERGANGQEIRGRFRKAKTYYLTTSGRRTPVKAAATPKRTPATN